MYIYVCSHKYNPYKLKSQQRKGKYLLANNSAVFLPKSLLSNFHDIFGPLEHFPFYPEWTSGHKMLTWTHAVACCIVIVQKCPLPARRWDRVYTAGVHRALSWCPCRFQHRSYTAGRWSPSHSTARTAPGSPWCGPPGCLAPGSSGQGSSSARQDTGNWTCKWRVCTHCWRLLLLKLQAGIIKVFQI